MAKQQFIKQMETLVANAELQKAIAHLHSNLQNTEFREPIILISSRFAELKQQIGSGVVSKTDADISRAQISKALLNLLNDLKDADIELDNVLIPQTASVNNKAKSFRLIVFVVLGLLVVISAFVVNKAFFSAPLSVKTDSVIVEKLSLKVITKPVYKENENLTLSVIANKPCYVRICLRTADGAAILVVDNLYIAESDINKEILVPNKLYCQPTKGEDILTAYSQTVPFDKVETKSKDEIQFIVHPSQAYADSKKGATNSNAFYKTEVKIVTQK